MFYKELSDGMRHFKETEGGRKVMCEAVEEYANEKARIAAEEAEKKAEEKVAQAEKKKAESMAIKMLEAGKYALDEIANLTGLSLSQVQMLQKKI
jgi:Fe-S cluster assembly ATPase SufC